MASDEYTIGWICVLPIEKAATRGMLDEIHNTSFIRAASDKNSYTLGRIGPHNIVVASLPSGAYGETPAATVAAHMLASLFAVHPKGTRIAFALVDETKAGINHIATVEEWDIVCGDLLCTHVLEAPIRVSKIQYSADGTRIDLVQYKESTSPPSMTTTRIRSWQPGQDAQLKYSKWRMEKHDLPRTGIWVTEDEAWIQYDCHYILYIPSHMRPMQHVYLGTSFDSVCNNNGEAVVGWITIEGLFTTFHIDLVEMRLAGIGVDWDGERVRGSLENLVLA